MKGILASLRLVSPVGEMVVLGGRRLLRFPLHGRRELPALHKQDRQAILSDRSCSCRTPSPRKLRLVRYPKACSRGLLCAKHPVEAGPVLLRWLLLARRLQLRRPRKVSNAGVHWSRSQLVASSQARESRRRTCESPTPFPSSALCSQKRCASKQITQLRFQLQTGGSF